MIRKIIFIPVFIILYFLNNATSYTVKIRSKRETIENKYKSIGAAFDASNNTTKTYKDFEESLDFETRTAYENIKSCTTEAFGLEKWLNSADTNIFKFFDKLALQADFTKLSECLPKEMDLKLLSKN